MKIFKIKGLPPTALYSEEPGYCSVVDTGTYSMNDKKDLDYVYWKIINNGNRPFLWVESPEKIFVIIRDLLEEGCYDYTVGKDPELRRNFSKVNSENVIICIKFPAIDAVRNRPELIPRFEWVMNFLYSILENAKKIYNKEKEAEKVCSAISLNDLYDRLEKAQKDAVEKELASAFGENVNAVVDMISINNNKGNLSDHLFAIETRIDIYPEDDDEMTFKSRVDKELHEIASAAGEAFNDGVQDALKTEVEKTISDGVKRKCKEIKNMENFEQALNAYLGLEPDGGNNHITDISDDTSICTVTGECEHKITITMRNFDEGN